MTPAQTEGTGSLGRHLAIGAVQVVLTLLAVAASRVNLEGHLAAVLVMVIAAVNAGVVAVAVLGVRRGGTIVSALAVCTVVVIAGLLVWPALDTASHARVF